MAAEKLRPELAQSVVFRPAAHGVANDPEQLNHVLKVTTARSWIALVAISALLAAALGWSLLGRVSTYVEGQGVFLREGGSIASVAAGGGGTLTSVLVGKGDQVASGQVVAEIQSVDTELQIQNLRALVTEREVDLQHQQSSTGKELSADRTALAQREAGLMEVQADAERRVKALKSRLSDEQELFEGHIVTRSAVLQVQAEVDKASQEVATTRDQIVQLDVETRDRSLQGEQRIKDAEFALADARRRLSEREKSYSESSCLRTPVAGTVNEIQLRPGNLVGRGQSILTIETAGQHLEFILFVPLREGDKVFPDQPVHVAPNWTVREEEGMLLGTVEEVSKLPVTPEGLRSLLHGEDLVQHFSGSGPVFQVHVRLQRDPLTRSGYAWTSSKGAEVSIESGSFGGGDVLVKSQLPISLAIPALRRWTGL